MTPHLWVLAVTRHLSCDPPVGQYRDPGLACKALRDMRLRLGRRHSVCSCPAILAEPAKAVGTLKGRLVEVPLDPCTACGLGEPAQRDLRVLIPM
jgi:hypothetical protein